MFFEEFHPAINFKVHIDTEADCLALKSAFLYYCPIFCPRCHAINFIFKTALSNLRMKTLLWLFCCATWWCSLQASEQSSISLWILFSFVNCERLQLAIPLTFGMRWDILFFVSVSEVNWTVCERHECQPKMQMYEWVLTSAKNCPLKTEPKWWPFA